MIETKYRVVSLNNKVVPHYYSGCKCEILKDNGLTLRVRMLEDNYPGAILAVTSDSISEYKG